MAKTYGNFTDFIDFSRASSGTYLGSDGLLKTAADNVPRIEYDANGNEIGLLIEEQRTNLLPYSEDFSNASWVAINSATKSASAVVAPDGSQNAYELTYPSTSGAVYEIVTVTASVHSFSVWLKADEVGQIRLARTGLGSDGENVTVTTEWQRFDVQITPTTTSDGPQIRRDATDQLTKVYVWGAQLEQGSFATSLIPTSGATATRSADIASIDVANFGYNQKAGTLVVEGVRLYDTASLSYASLNDGTSLNRFTLYIQASEKANGYVYGNGGGLTLSGPVLTPPTSATWGMSYEQIPTGGHYELAVDGTSYFNSDSVYGEFSGKTKLSIGSAFGLSEFANGHIKSIKYIPRRNTNTQLQEFTS